MLRSRNRRCAVVTPLGCEWGWLTSPRPRPLDGMSIPWRNGDIQDHGQLPWRLRGRSPRARGRRSRGQESTAPVLMAGRAGDYVRWYREVTRGAQTCR